MSGIYGNIRPADVSLEDIEVFLHFTPSRNQLGDVNFTKLNTNDVLIKLNNPNNVNNIEIFGGVYTLKLPTSLFGVKGFYTIMIKPIEIRTKIIDTGVLASQPNIRGLVFDSTKVSSNFISKFKNNGLIGYRIEYLNKTSTNVKINNFFRIITSNNKSEPVSQNLTNTNQKAIRYRFNDNSNLVFCTVTPNSNSDIKSNVVPYIGEPNQDVIITNTYFNPIMLEIEMVEYDMDTLAIGVFGNQTKTLEDGVYTLYDKNNEIYKQYDLFEIMDQFTGKPLTEVKQERSNIDFTKNFKNLNTI